MLALNPNDNQGVRYSLLDQLLVLERHDEAAALLARYKGDGSAHWLYGEALLLFKTKGDTPATRRALDAARKHNAHVPPFLLGTKRLPRRSPEFVGWGDTSEAVAYAQDCGGAWRTTPGALDWLARGVG
jgi:hypothetical protein